MIEPYGTVTISGWQTSMTHARRFEFTTEERSYGAWLGKTDDLGVISAVFFRERAPAQLVTVAQEREPRAEAPAPAGRSDAKAVPAGEAGARSAAVDEYTATGIGRRTDHAVRQVHLDLESTPAASISLRYEFRAQLVRLGVLSRSRPTRSTAASALAASMRLLPRTEAVTLTTDRVQTRDLTLVSPHLSSSTRVRPAARASLPSRVSSVASRASASAT